MKKLIHWPSLLIGLGAATLIALLVSAFSSLAFWPVFVIVVVAVLVNGVVATVEDEMPGGFNNPRPTTLLPLIAPQRRKLWLCAVILIVSGAGVFAPEQISRVVGAASVVVTLGGIAAGLLALAIASLSIRCPSCGLGLAWYALSKQPHHAWLSWLLTVEVCPRCRFSHSSAQGAIRAE
ncbi:MAG TPA: hypothetical protein PLT48_17565 [Nitrospira sp.]|jgi:hypothetical protein|nr:hypothetical protein [Nitrospira sp.]